MIKYHKTGKYKGKPNIKLMTAQEHWDYLMDTMNIYHDDNGCRYIDLSDIKGYPQVVHRGKVITITRLLVANARGCEVSDLDGFNHSWRHTYCSNTMCINPDHGAVGTNKENCYDGDKGKSNPVRIQAENEHEVLYFPSAEEAGRAGFDRRNVSKASRGIHASDCRHGGTHMYKGYYWTRV